MGAADGTTKRKEKRMSETAASLWQLVRDDQLVRRGAYVCIGVVWFAAAWADLKLLLMIPMVAGGIYVLYRRRPMVEDDIDLL